MSDPLGPLPPQKEGQCLTMLICGPGNGPAECGHWLSPEHVQRRIDEAVAAERERMIAQGWPHCAQGQRTTQFCGQAESLVAAERERWLALIRDDALACTFQTMGQYRTRLLAGPNDLAHRPDTAR